MATQRITKNLLDDNAQLLYKGRPLAETFILQETVFVSKSGNNTLAVKGRMDRAYLTIQAAVDANPQTIVILGGEYVERVDILSSSALNRLLFWFGATLVSSAAYTLGVGRAQLVIEGHGGPRSSAWNFIAAPAIINNAAAGRTIIRLGNPGAVPIYLRGMNIEAQGTAEGSACFFGHENYFLDDCYVKFANRGWLAEYGQSYYVEARNCFFKGKQLANQNFYDAFYGAFEGCHIDVQTGIFVGNSNNGLILRLKNSVFKTSVGTAFEFSSGFAQGLEISDSTVIAQTQVVKGFFAKFFASNSTLASRTTEVANVDRYHPSWYHEYRNCKIIAGDAATYSLVNSNPSSKEIHLFNCQLNKLWNGNVDGIFNDVVVDDSLKIYE